MRGKGKYDDQLTEALKACGGTRGVLIVIDGKQGSGFSVQVVAEDFLILPSALRAMAAQIERDTKEIKK